MSSSKNKKERRLQRHLRNVEKDRSHKEEAWAEGKLIEPNHNNGPYPVEYSVELGSRLRKIMADKKNMILSAKTEEADSDRMIFEFRKYRQKVRDYLIHYNPEAPKDENYMFLINLYETYQDEPQKIINL